MFEGMIPTLIVIAVLLWTLPWKGVALWKAARAGDKVWFVILLLVNTLAILEILYIFIFSKKKKLEEKEAPVQFRKVV